MYPNTSLHIRGAAARILLVTALATAACAKDAPTAVTPAPSPIVGSFQLSAVNGRALPGELYSGIYIDPADDSYHDVRTYAVSGSLELFADGKYHQKIEVAQFVDGQPNVGMHWDDIGFTERTDDASVLHFTSNKWQNTAYRATVGSGAKSVTTEQNLVGQEAGSRPANFQFLKP